MPKRKRGNDSEGADRKEKKTAHIKPTAMRSGPGKFKSKPTVNGRDSKSKPTTETFSHWLMKSEPESRFENGVDVKARNFMRDQMKIGHLAFFYHSNCKEPGIAGICKIVKESYPDHTQFDRKDPHFDSASSKDNPRWFMVDVQYIRMMKRYIPLSELKALHLKHKESGGPLKNIALFTRARLSVQPVREEEWNFILSLENNDQD